MIKKKKRQGPEGYSLYELRYLCHQTYPGDELPTGTVQKLRLFAESVTHASLWACAYLQKTAATFKPRISQVFLMTAVQLDPPGEKWDFDMPASAREMRSFTEEQKHYLLDETN